jgi:TusA-related sulfurtransferase
VTRTDEALRELEPGAELTVVCDDPFAVVDIPVFCDANRHVYLGHVEDDGVFRIRVRKAGGTRPRAIGLLSGGLDSTLAARLLQEQGIDVQGVHFATGFCKIDHRRTILREKERRRPERVRHEALEAAGRLQVPLEVIDVSEEFLREVVLNPRYGYGSAMNPCIDCRIFMLRKADEIAREKGAQVVFTGEVVGQRPMSQRRAELDLIEKKAGLEGRLLRPLSAKKLPPTDAESAGIVDRERLGEAHGRSRREQFRLAASLGVDDYPTPGGGCCFLADRNFARRFRDHLAHTGEDGAGIDTPGIALLKVGRHFRLGHDIKAIFGRDEPESTYLRQHAGTTWWTCQVADGLGSFGILDAEPVGERIVRAASLAARYSRQRAERDVEVRVARGDRERIVRVAPAEEAVLRDWLV